MLRQARQTLNIQGANPGRRFAPGDDVQLGLAIRDEADRPQAAVLGVKVIRLSGATESLGPLETRLALQSGVQAMAEGLAELADLDAVEGREAEPLGAATRDRRRGLADAEQRAWFARVEEAEQSGAGQTPEAAPQRPATAATVVQNAALGLLADNTDAVRATLDREVAAWHVVRETDLHRVGQVLIAGVLAVLLGLGLAGLARLGTARPGLGSGIRRGDGLVC